jgi:hypothetical protein
VLDLLLHKSLSFPLNLAMFRQSLSSLVTPMHEYREVHKNDLVCTLKIGEVIIYVCEEDRSVVPITTPYSYTTFFINKLFGGLL